MIASLTGYGRGEAGDDTLAYIAELRSVNNRYLELSTRLPRSLVSYEHEFRNALRGKVERGKVQLHIQENRAAQRESRFNVDASAARNLLDTLRELSAETGLEDDLTLSDLLPMLDSLAGDEDEELSKRKLTLALEALRNALSEFLENRRAEGANLDADFRQRLDLLEEITAKVETKSGENRAGQLEKLRERIERYVPSDKVDPGRLEQEVAYVIDRLDITEEIVRLGSHITLFREALDKGGAVGKKLNFILQEINREVNTIGSKASDGEVASWVVQAKEEVEKIREQVQNVE